MKKEITMRIQMCCCKRKRPVITKQVTEEFLLYLFEKNEKEGERGD